MSEHPSRVEVRIDELVLHGVDPADRLRIGDAVERELTRLLAQRPLPAAISSGGDVDRIDGLSRRVAGRSSAATVGTAAARAIYEGMNR